jgi:hypothetical protein
MKAVPCYSACSTFVCDFCEETMVAGSLFAIQFWTVEEIEGVFCSEVCANKAIENVKEAAYVHEHDRAGEQ